MCNWNLAQLADNLRDKFVMGLYNEHLLQQLLSQDHKKSLEDLFQHALTFEAESLKRAESGVTTSVSVLEHKKSKSTAKPLETHPPKQLTQLTKAVQPGLCNGCGENHARSMCHFRKEIVKWRENSAPLNK